MKKFYNNIVYKTISGFLFNLPTPVNITIFWNFGSLLGMCLIIQILTGLFLTMHYVPNVLLSFYTIVHIMQDVNYGWVIRLIHMNGASVFFFCVYFHIGRALYYGSFKLKLVWLIGVMIFFLMMGTAFMGYVLPWGQMSFWGATVITNLLSALPFVGEMLVYWLWGGFSVDTPTLNRFYTFHFIMPFILMFMVGMHLIYLHQGGSSNPLGVNSNFYKVIFHNYFTLKDLLGFLILFKFLMYLVLETPYILGDPENFIMANSMVTPIHIQPEWYFLFAYTILRCIPNKFMGVVALLMSILILCILPFIHKSKFQGTSFYKFNQFYYWSFVMNFFILTWLGGQLVESPYVFLSQISSLFYFFFFFFDYLFKLMWDNYLE